MRWQAPCQRPPAGDAISMWGTDEPEGIEFNGKLYEKAWLEAGNDLSTFTHEGRTFEVLDEHLPRTG